jgi:hypothetical protein
MAAGLERFLRYKTAKDAGYGWRSLKPADAMAASKRKHGSSTHHRYALWPSGLMDDAARHAATLGVHPDSIELVAEITVVDTDPVITRGRKPVMDITVTPKGVDPYQEKRYQRVVRGARNDMRHVLAHLRHADETRRATAVRFFFRLKA